MWATALEFLLTETEYKLSGSDDARIPYDEVPEFRVRAAKIARLLRESPKDCPPIIERWIEAAHNDPLPEVRQVVEGIGEKQEAKFGNDDDSASPPPTIEALHSLVKKATGEGCTLEEQGKLAEELNKQLIDVHLALHLESPWDKLELAENISLIAANLAKHVPPQRAEKMAFYELCRHMLRGRLALEPMEVDEFHGIAADDVTIDAKRTRDWLDEKLSPSSTRKNPERAMKRTSRRKKTTSRREN